VAIARALDGEHAQAPGPGKETINPALISVPFNCRIADLVDIILDCRVKVGHNVCSCGSLPTLEINLSHNHNETDWPEDARRAMTTKYDGPGGSDRATILDRPGVATSGASRGVEEGRRQCGNLPSPGVRSETAPEVRAADLVGARQAARQRAGAVIDPRSAEIMWGWAKVADPYDELDIPDEDSCTARTHYARASGESAWIAFIDIPGLIQMAIWERLRENRIMLSPRAILLADNTIMDTEDSLYLRERLRHSPVM
jgi:hypothetical protein